MSEPSDDFNEYPEPLMPYVPTTQVVKDAYVRGMRNAFIASASEHEQEFERWFKVQTLPLATIRAEYERYRQHGDMHELARAVGQIVGNVPPEELDGWIDNPQPVERPRKDADG